MRPCTAAPPNERVDPGSDLGREPDVGRPATLGRGCKNRAVYGNDVRRHRLDGMVKVLVSLQVLRTQKDKNNGRTAVLSGKGARRIIRRR